MFLTNAARLRDRPVVGFQVLFEAANIMKGLGTHVTNVVLFPLIQWDMCDLVSQEISLGGEGSIAETASDVLVLRSSI